MNTKMTRDPIDLMALGVIVLTAFLCIVTACTSTGCGYMIDDEKPLHALKDEGYTAATITDRHVIAPGLFGCDEKDTAGYGVSATNVTGAKVNLIVCCGILKGCTIRH
jgi:hypothetical protein